ncbi:MAG: DUF4397 domain-containing protein [Anaerolineae bacterium]
MKRKALVSLMLVLILALMSFAMASAQEPPEEPAMVYVGHGIPGVVVDVAVNGDCELPGFEFGQFAGPLELSEAKIQVYPADEEKPCTGTAVIETDVDFTAGENYTVFAHLAADGDFNASVFVNDVSDAVAGHTRLTVRHTAAAPAVDIYLNRGWERGRSIAEVEDLANLEQAGPLDIRPGAYMASIFAAGTEDLVLAQRIVLKPHRSFIVYAVGDLDTETFTLLTQMIELGKVPPPRPEPPVGPPMP